MSVPTFSMRQLLEAGIHFGHHPRRWNPRMGEYLFGVRNNIHIINLEHTVPMLHQALQAVHDTIKDGGRVLFVGTKPQASDIVAESAKRCGQYYVNHRWLGGMMTNWKTISHSIKRLEENEKTLSTTAGGMTKKEKLKLTRETEKLERAIGGIREMGGLPTLLFVIDTNREQTAIKEARNLGIPVVGVVDSNCDPTEIDFPIPGNDDAIRSIRFYCDIVANTVLGGIQDQMAQAGVDMGASAQLPEDAAPAKAEKKPAAKKADAAAKKAPVKKADAEEKKPAAKKATAKKDDAAEEKKPAAKKTAAAEKKPAAKKATAEKKPAPKKADTAEKKPAAKKAAEKTKK